MRELRQYGWGKTRYVSERPGWNARLDEVQAAILRVKLRGLEADNERRREIAAMYNERLAGVPGIVLPEERGWIRCVYHQFVIRSERRDALAAGLAERGVQTLVHYPVPVHLQPAYSGRGLTAGPMVETERAAREVLSLPMFPELTDEQVERVAAAVRQVVEADGPAGL